MSLLIESSPRVVRTSALKSIPVKVSGTQIDLAAKRIVSIQHDASNFVNLFNRDETGSPSLSYSFTSSPRDFTVAPSMA
jgi:hypothetical protein